MIKKTMNILSADQASNLQSSVQNTAIDALSSNPLMSGSLLSAIDLATGSNTINHKLGRKIQGWIIVDRSAAATLYREDWDASVLKLNAGAPVTVTLYVF